MFVAILQQSYNLSRDSRYYQSNIFFLLVGFLGRLSLVFTRRKRKHKDQDKRLNKKIQRSVQRKHRHNHEHKHKHKRKTEQKQKTFQKKTISLCFKSHYMAFFFCINACSYAYACVK